MEQALGILGVGHLASYVVAGLRNAGDNRRMLLSPRNSSVGMVLSDSYGAERLESNQAVVDRAQLILVAVRPRDLVELLDPLVFSPDQLVISCVAGEKLARIGPLTGDADIVRALPLACAEVGKGAIPLFPWNEEAVHLLSQLGHVITFDDESKFELGGVASCTNGWMYKFFHELSKWYVDRGLEPEQARALVIETCLGAASLASEKGEWSLLSISESIATDGTFTKAGLDLLEAKGAFQPWIDASDLIEKALKG